MPHAIISGGPEPIEVHRQFVQFKENRADGTILETRAAFLRLDEQVVLIHAMSVELGPAQNFFVAVERKRKQLTVRCHPFPSPERTPGVQAVVLHVAKQVLALGGELEKTNLEF